MSRSMFVLYAYTINTRIDIEFDTMLLYIHLNHYSHR